VAGHVSSEKTQTGQQKKLISGNEAIGEGAIRAGVKFYGGYPITPQNDLTAYMADQLPLRGGEFVQAESEIAAINMLYGASAAGVRCMTSSSSPGISLKQEGISYLAGSELPAVIINVERGGPGLGDISPSQGDYYQTTRGGGHGDYRCLSLAPMSVQEAADFTYLAFDLADRYRTPVIVAADGLIGQMMEPAAFEHLEEPEPAEKPWALTGAEGRERNIVKSFYPVKGELEEFNEKLQQKYRRIQKNEVRYEESGSDNASLLMVAYGTCARVCGELIKHPPSRLEGELKLLRPITLWPFPHARIREMADELDGILTVEMNAGQMIDDVRLAVEGRCPVELHGRPGGGIPGAEEIARKLTSLRE
jgi:2-oxoglutarate ferredoxin oxidoreductase subunit alpha